MTNQRTYGSGLVRDVDLLEVLARPEARGGLGVSRIAELSGRDKAQVSRALATLADAGLVDRDEHTRAYRPGWRLFALATHATETHLAQLAAPFLRTIVARLNETTHLCVLRAGQVFTVRSELASHAFRGLGWEGVGVDPFTTSPGRVLLSEWDAETVGQWWRTFPPASAPPLPDLPGPAAPVAPLTLERLTAKLARIRRRGYETVDEEFEPGLVGVSAPVYGFRGDLVAAVNVSAPKSRLGGRLPAAGRFARTVADRISETLGAGR
ncbi:IclR family transcriptional regulator [Amycolatopsis benzoatilytica]|uniref:IclR family transcriptional regulator n=1 Tax=Amycolatopsis benzoatilytica TaxID=346045 RepID=UPI00036CD9C2|nr:IclR family transcriptional regulator [Amycolatopsis benzoatilytica]